MNEPLKINLSIIQSYWLDEIIDAIELWQEEGDVTLINNLQGKSDCPKDLKLLLDIIRSCPENPRPLCSILRIVRKRYNCFAIIEYPYLDLEFWAGYSKVYSASFSPYERPCYRIHFFSARDYPFFNGSKSIFPNLSCFNRANSCKPSSKR